MMTRIFMRGKVGNDNIDRPKLFTGGQDSAAKGWPCLSGLLGLQDIPIFLLNLKDYDHILR